MVILMAGTGRHSDPNWAGRSVKSLRTQYADVFNIAATAKPVVNGDSVSEDYILQDGDELLFAKSAGEKGSR